MDSFNPPSLETFKILLVDDEPSTLQLVRKILQADGHKVYEALDGVQAIEMFEAVKPDLVLLDVVIPKIDGLGVLQEIRRRDRFAGVIMVSALTSEQLAVKSMLSGADDYISKPFKFLHTIRLHIRQVMDKVHLRRHNATLQDQLLHANEQLRHYMAAPLVDTLMASSTLPSLGGERQVVTILFMDFCNFSSISHDFTPDQLLQLLNDYFAELATSIFDNKGYMDKILGDGFMALFNVPVGLSDHAMMAVRAAVQMRRQLFHKNLLHEVPMRMRVGIHTGEAIVGNIGTARFMNYTAIGDAVNFSKRLEESSEPGQILLSAATRNLLNMSRLEMDGIQICGLGQRNFKGFTQPEDIYHIKDMT